MAGVFDFKKEYKDLYLPKAKPGVIDVPVMNFIMVDGLPSYSLLMASPAR